jgi:hypothetical protein
MKRLASLIALMAFMPTAMADSYRYMHVSIDTPWSIFIFLLFAVLMPFILMAILYWRNAMRRNAEEDMKGEE